MEEEISFVDLLIPIYRKKFFIITIVLLSCLITGIMSLNQKRVYKAKITFFPITRTLPATFEQELLQRQGNINFLISVLQSNKILDLVISQADLEKKWNTENLWQAEELLKKSTKIKPISNTNILELSVITSEPKLSADIANLYIENLRKINLELELTIDPEVVRVLEPGREPIIPEPRGTVKKLLAAGLGSFVFGVFFSFLIEYFQRNKIMLKLKTSKLVVHNESDILNHINK